MAESFVGKIAEALANGKGAKKDWQKTLPNVGPQESYHLLQLAGDPDAASYSGTALHKVVVTGGDSPSLTPGILPFPDPGLGESQFLYQALAESLTSGLSGVLRVVDLLAYYPNFDADDDTNQDTNSSAGTTAITRYSDGDDVWFVIDPMSTLGSGGADITLTYTAKGGGTGHTATLALTPSAVKGQLATKPWRFKRQSGDGGALSLQRVKLSAGMGGGSFAVAMVRELAQLFFKDGELGKVTLIDDLLLEQLKTGAAPSFLFTSEATVSAPVLVGAARAVRLTVP